MPTGVLYTPHMATTDMILEFIDHFFFTLYSIPCVYLAIFAAASLLKNKKQYPPALSFRKMVILVPAFKEDAVIDECVESCLNQDYPKEYCDIVVISDQMTDETNERLSKLPIQLMKVEFENSTKAKSINFAMDQLVGYDIAIILDADNVIENQFVSKINNAFDAGRNLIQAHRTAKNLNTSYAVLDAVSEEINNSIFRKGHNRVRLSAALIGSGMAFQFEYFRYVMKKVKAVGGFDKDIEHIVMMDRKKVHYLDYAMVYDEKIQKDAHFSMQRRRWMAAQFEHFMRYNKLFIKGVLTRNFDFCDKVFQMLLPPRVLVLGGLLFMCLAAYMKDETDALKWFGMLCLLALTFFVAIPRRMINKQFFVALLTMPNIFLITLKNIFKLKNANKKFIHTPHGKQ